MKLLELKLENFKGCKALTIVPNGLDFDIYGDNATGKTTIADAFYWLFFGKDSQNKTDFEIKPLDANNNAIHGLESVVEGKLESNGETITFKRSYKEVFTKRTGAPTATFTGHTSDYWVDGEPVLAGEFKRRVDDACPEKKFRLLTDPLFFSSALKWEERRAMVVGLAQITDEEVIASCKELKHFAKILDGKTIEARKKITAETITGINNELKEIPVRISELNNMLADVPNRDHTGDVLARKSRLAGLQSTRLAIENGGEIANLTKRLREIEGMRIDIANKSRSTVNPERQSAQVALRTATDAFDAANRALSANNRLLEDLQVQLSSIQGKIQVARADAKAENARIYTGDKTCPSCGQDVPAEAYQTAVEAFNTAKATRLAAMVANGKALLLQETVTAQRIEEATQVSNELKAKAEQLAAERDAIVIPEDKPIDHTVTAEWKELAAEYAQVIDAITKAKAGTADQLAKVDSDIENLEKLISESQAWVSKQAANTSTKVRISELAAREKELSAQYEDLQKTIFLIEKFLRAQAALLSEVVNAKFSLVKIKLFDEQINGALNPCCDVTVNGVTFGSLNHGAQINAGLDIINTFGKVYDFVPPIFVDNAESVTKLIPTHGQKIRLVVSESDKSLRYSALGEPVTSTIAPSIVHSINEPTEAAPSEPELF